MTYAVMGLCFGLLGNGFLLVGWQNVLSIVLGCLLLMTVALPRLAFSWTKNIKVLELLKSRIMKLFAIHTWGSLFLIGILNGFLPCGLVYIGITGAVATGNALNGAVFMMGFGLGTLPAMLALTVAGGTISIKFRMRIRKAVPVFVGAMAILLILRGMNLGLPYISPSTDHSKHYKCCEE
jgi:uncharacterized protein